MFLKGFPGGSVVKKNLPANAGDVCSIPGLGRSSGWCPPYRDKANYKR